MIFSFLSLKEMQKTMPIVAKLIWTGTFFITIFVVVFIVWATVIPLETAAIAQGKVIVESSRKTIQHLEGGIIQTIYTKEGAPVKAGEKLIKLNDTQARANYEILHKSVNDLLAKKARLLAERDQSQTINMPQTLVQEKNNEDIATLIQNETDQFHIDTQALAAQLIIFENQIAQSRREISSIQAQVQANDTQLALIEKEVTAIAYLEKKHLVEKPRLWALQREAARLSGNKGEQLALISRAEQRIEEIKEKMLAVKENSQKEIMQHLNETDAKLADAKDREKAALDILQRTLIVAPEDGVVVGLREHTIGGVITPGKPIMDLVPKNDKLILEVHVNPLNIEAVREGLKAKVNLIAYHNRGMPELDGAVTYVSADSFIDDKKDSTYYIAHVLVAPTELKKLKHVKLYPGMPVEVMIITGKRTALSYLLSPLYDSYNHAFREK